MCFSESSLKPNVQPQKLSIMMWLGLNYLNVIENLPITVFWNLNILLRIQVTRTRYLLKACPWAIKNLHKLNSISLFFQLKMAVKLWGSKTPGNAQDVRDFNLLKNKKKVIKMLVIVVVLFCVAWFPLQMYNILNVTWPEVNEYRHINIIWLCFDWLAMSNSCYNPFIYGIYNVSIIKEIHTVGSESWKLFYLLHIPKLEFQFNSTHFFSHFSHSVKNRKSSSGNSTNAFHSFTSMALANVSISRRAEWTQVQQHWRTIRRRPCQCTTPAHQYLIIHRTT